MFNYHNTQAERPDRACKYAEQQFGGNPGRPGSRVLVALARSGERGEGGCCAVLMAV